MDASAIVPGPALVTKVSDARIHSSMLFTNPLTKTLTPGPHCWLDNSSCADLLFPQTTTSWYDGEEPLPPSFSPRALAISTMPPIPSPPPTTSTAGNSSSNPSCDRRFAERSWGAALSSSPPFLRNFLRNPEGASGELSASSCAQNPFRIGRPYCTICELFSPRDCAFSFSTSDGTKHLSTLMKEGSEICISRWTHSP
jgi:hypothetical protein